MILSRLDRQQGLALWALTRELSGQLGELEPPIAFVVHVGHLPRRTPSDPAHCMIQIDLTPADGGEPDTKALDELVRNAVTRAVIGGVDGVTFHDEDSPAGVRTRVATLTWRAQGGDS